VAYVVAPAEPPLSALSRLPALCWPSLCVAAVVESDTFGLTASSLDCRCALPRRRETPAAPDSAATARESRSSLRPHSSCPSFIALCSSCLCIQPCPMIGSATARPYTIPMNSTL
jgi:hypothetical protein